MFTLALWLATPALALEPCASPPHLASVADDLRDILANGNNLHALDLVSSAEANFECLDAFVTTTELVSTYQLAGTAAFYSSARGQAEPLFARAVMVGPNVTFDAANLGAEAAASYAAVRDRVSAGEMGTITTLGAVVLNGTTVRRGSTVVVPPGLHLVQEELQGHVTSSVVRVDAGATVPVGHAPPPDPALVAAQRALQVRRRTTLVAAGSGSLVVGAGLLVTAGLLERDFHDTDPALLEAAGTDPAKFARGRQFATDATAILGMTALAGGAFLGWRGVSVRLTPPVDEAASVTVTGTW